MGVVVILYPVVLSQSQVEEYDLPLMISDDPAKALRAWQEERGGRVELDALEATAPGVLATLVQEASEAFRDVGLERRVERARGGGGDFGAPPAGGQRAAPGDRRLAGAL